jgi:hypothetical protein
VSETLHLRLRALYFYPDPFACFQSKD